MAAGARGTAAAICPPLALTQTAETAGPAPAPPHLQSVKGHLLALGRRDETVQQNVLVALEAVDLQGERRGLIRAL